MTQLDGRINREYRNDSTYGITSFGEILIDFTWQGHNEQGQALFAQNPGGAPANVAVAASRLGTKTAFLGKAGRDMHGRFLKSVLEQEEVDTRGLILDADYFTTLAFVRLGTAGERTFAFARKPGADTQIRADEIAAEILANTNIFHVGSLSLTDQPARDTTLYAVKQAKKMGSIISYDPNYRESLWTDAKTAVEQMRSLIPYADIMKLSDEEIVLLTGYDDPEEAARELVAQGIKVVAVTLGPEGTYIYGMDGGREVPGYVSNVVDTTGAGDSFWGGFLHCLNQSGKCPEELSLSELEEYARFGNAVASLCVEGKGAIPAMPYPEAVAERLQQMI